MSNMIIVEKKLKELVIKLLGRIDSGNSAALETEIDSCIAENPSDTVVLDAENLEYTSSAGLRVILRLLKKIRNLRMINASSDVYEVMEMTGFTEMMPVEKAYRCLSVDGCEIIGTGSNGEVYRLDKDTIIKVYNSNDSLPDIQRERELARKAFVLGIPTAIPYDVVKVGNSYGSVFELLNARSFTKIICEEPERFEEIVEMYVNLLKKIHSTQVRPDDMPNMKTAALGWVDYISTAINHDKYLRLRELVQAVPESLGMIHGDYHTKNVMLQDGEPLLIDMDTLCYGNPVFEFASIFNAYVGFYSANPPLKGVSFIGIPYETGLKIWDRTLELYFGTQDRAFLDSIVDRAALLGYTRILRRTLRRCDISVPQVKHSVDFYTAAIENLIDRVDSLTIE